MTHTGTILITGGTGKTGRRVATRLPGARVASRGGTPPFDWHERATWEPALAGVEAAYLSYWPDISAPEAAGTLRAFAGLAAARGVRRLVLLSGRGMDSAAEAEAAVRESGTEWTILRGSWFCQNFSEDFLLDPVRAGEFTLPAAPGVVEPFIDAEDIADVAVAALTGAGHAGRTYELTTGRALTLEEAAAEIGEAAGRTVAFRAVGRDQYADDLTAQGQPPEIARLLAGLFTDVLDGRNAAVSGDVAAVLGRPPRDFSDFARRAAAAGAWAG
ncbi:NmrA family NAD(P)-binding protein [Streptomyces marincola]|uniref:NmrA family NAD(P)-binding protein n=1 Tax=Streptomyces marincola TaxID=2878388 RepID=UPI001CF2F88F|nr:NmrA family transcriptional regulator [Streptomyces marincola]UCM87766.1 NmrA family transcriptional regulator [Streptomyces marincola]